MSCSRYGLQVVAAGLLDDGFRRFGLYWTTVILSPPPGSTLTEDYIGSHMKSIELVAHHAGSVQGRGSIAPVKAKRWD